MLPVPPGPLLEKFTTLLRLLMIVALPAVPLPLKNIKDVAPLLLVRVALPAVLSPLKWRKLLLVMAALPAELELEKISPPPTVKVGTFEELLTMPVPLMVKFGPDGAVVKEKAGAPASSWIVPIETEPEIVIAVVAPLLVNVAVLPDPGTEPVDQLMPVVHAPVAPIQVPSTACAAGMSARLRHVLASSAVRCIATMRLAALRGNT